MDPANQAQQVVAITGAAGFLGQALVERLRREPTIREIIALDQRQGPEAEKVRWVKMDVRSPELVGALKGADTVVHLAFVVLGDLTEADSINVQGSENLFDSAGRAGCKRLVFLSSVAAYGHGLLDRPLTEEDPLRPIESFTYSRTKAAAERAMDRAGERYPGMTQVRLRPCIILGPGCHKPLALWSKSRVHFSLGDHAGIQFVHVDDVVEACRLAVVGSASGIFNIAAPGTLSPRELADLAGARLVRLPANLARGAMRLMSALAPRKGLDAGWLTIAERPPVVSTLRAERDLGWKAKKDVRELAAEFLAEQWGASQPVE
jgi:nucleoside-diphosphate-sugar epimerase